MNIGQRFFELISYREKLGKRETTMVGILQFVSGTIWMQLFGKTADALEKSTEQAHACKYCLDGGLSGDRIIMYLIIR